MTFIQLIFITRLALRQRTIAHRHYLVPLSPFPRRSPIDRRMSMSNSNLHKRCRMVHHAVFFAICLRPPQKSRILKSAHVALPTLSIPRRCHHLFHTTVNSTLYVQTFAGKQEVGLKSAKCVDSADMILKRISQLRRFYRIPTRMPKSCRIRC